MLQQSCPYCGSAICNHSGYTATTGWNTNTFVIWVEETPKKSLDDGRSAMWLHWVIPQRRLKPEVRRPARLDSHHPAPKIAPPHMARPRTPVHAFGHSPRKTYRGRK